MSSDSPFGALADLNRLVHSPARLAILTALSACESADFMFLQNLTGLTKGNLSANLIKLEQASLLEVEKRFEGKLSRTIVRLSEDGRKAIDAYWTELDSARDAVRRWEKG